MTLTIDLTPAEEARLTAAATHEGIPAQELVRRVLAANLPSVQNSGETDPTLALFAQWQEEDARMATEEKAEAERDLEEFKQNINAERERAGARLVY